VLQRDQLQLQEAELRKMEEAMQLEQQANSSLKLTVEQLKTELDLKTKFVIMITYWYCL